MNSRNIHDHTLQRLDALEIKASFTEDLLERLDQVIVRQQGQIDALVAEVLRLRLLSQSSDLDTSRHAQDDLPPHY